MSWRNDYKDLKLFFSEDGEHYYTYTDEHKGCEFEETVKWSYDSKVEDFTPHPVLTDFLSGVHSNNTEAFYNILLNETDITEVLNFFDTSYHDDKKVSSKHDLIPILRRLHDFRIGTNHIDVCGDEYEQALHDWNDVKDTANQRFIKGLAKAGEILENQREEVDLVIKFVEGLAHAAAAAPTAVVRK